MRKQGWLLGLGVLCLAALLTLPTAIRFAFGIHETSSLPSRIYACNRDWTVDRLARTRTLAGIVDQTTGRPTIVNPGPLGLFTVCPFPSDATVDAVIYVRVDLDGYVDYALSGGP